MAIRKATHRLIDSVWTMEFEVQEDGKARLIKYTRQDPEGYEKERELMQGTIIENKDDGKRIATKIVLRPYNQFDGWANEKNCTESYEIANPSNIFDFGA